MKKEECWHEHLILCIMNQYMPYTEWICLPKRNGESLIKEADDKWIDEFGIKAAYPAMEI